jgi:GMP synthase (glutamine-hydrolysing)
MKIGILQSGHSPKELLGETGNYADLFVKLLQGQGFEFETFSVVEMDFPDGPNDCDGWLITGSKHGAYEDHAFIAPLEDLIRQIYAAEHPLVGICFGHQIIAQALGGKVEKFKDGWAVGRQSYDWQNKTVHLNAWHQDQVVELPADATVCASNDFCANAALVYGKNAFTVQAHPEFDGNFISGLATYRGPGVVPEPLLDEARAAIDAPVDNVFLAHQIGQFFKERSIA